MGYIDVGTLLNSETTLLGQADILTDNFEWKFINPECSFGISNMVMAEGCNGMSYVLTEEPLQYWLKCYPVRRHCDTNPISSASV